MPRQPSTLGPLLCEKPGASGYRRGCRCFMCRTANSTKQASFFAAKGGNLWRDNDLERLRYHERRAAGQRVEWTPQRQARWEARAALKRGAPDSETFPRREVFDRDGWICGICHDPVDPDCPWPEPMSPSLDHVIPVTRGGSHSRANTQCSHLVCNIRKGNRTEAQVASA